MAKDPNEPILPVPNAPQAFPAEPTAAQRGKLSQLEQMAIDFNPSALESVGYPPPPPVPGHPATNYHEKINTGLSSMQASLGEIQLKVGEAAVNADATGSAKTVYDALQSAMSGQPGSDQIIQNIVQNAKDATNSFTNRLLTPTVEGIESAELASARDVTTASMKTIADYQKDLQVFDSNKENLEAAQKAEKDAISNFDDDVITMENKNSLLAQLDTKHKQQNEELQKKQKEHEDIMNAYRGGATALNAKNLLAAMEGQGFTSRVAGAFSTVANLGDSTAAQNQALQRHQAVKQELNTRGHLHEGEKFKSGGITFKTGPGSIVCERGALSWGNPKESGKTYAEGLIASNSGFKIKTNPKTGQRSLNINVKTLDGDPSTMKKWRPMLMAAQRHLASEHGIRLEIQGIHPPQTHKEREAMLKAIQQHETQNVRHAKPSTEITGTQEDGRLSAIPGTGVIDTPKPSPTPTPTNVEGKPNMPSAPTKPAPTTAPPPPPMPNSNGIPTQEPPPVPTAPPPPPMPSSNGIPTHKPPPVPTAPESSFPKPTGATLVNALTLASALPPACPPGSSGGRAMAETSNQTISTREATIELGRPTPKHLDHLDLAISKAKEEKETADKDSGVSFK